MTAKVLSSQGRGLLLWTVKMINLIQETLKAFLTVLAMLAAVCLAAIADLTKPIVKLNRSAERHFDQLMAFLKR